MGLRRAGTVGLEQQPAAAVHLPGRVPTRRAPADLVQRPGAALRPQLRGRAAVLPLVLSMYASLTELNGERIFWYSDRKIFGLGRYITDEMLRDAGAGVS